MDIKYINHVPKLGGKTKTMVFADAMEQGDNCSYWIRIGGIHPKSALSVCDDTYKVTEYHVSIKHNLEMSTWKKWLYQQRNHKFSFQK